MKISLQFENVQEIPNDIKEIIFGYDSKENIFHSNIDLYRDLKKKLNEKGIEYFEIIDGYLNIDQISDLIIREKKNQSSYIFSNQYGESIIFKKLSLFKMIKK